jgi:hypothetical protein
MEVINDRIYIHYKGDHYIVIDTALNHEDNEVYVVYRALYGNGELYVTPLKEFTAEIDREKVPNAPQLHNFELLNIPSVDEDFYGSIL